MDIEPGFNELIPNAEVRDSLVIPSYTSLLNKIQSKNRLLSRKGPKPPCKIIELAEGDFLKYQVMGWTKE